MKRYSGLPIYILRYNSLVSFNQGVAGSNPARLTKAGEPPPSGDFEENQGVTTLGLPTP